MRAMADDRTPLRPGQLAVVDHGAHAGAQRGAEEQEPQPERHGERHDHLSDPVVGDRAR